MAWWRTHFDAEWSVGYGLAARARAEARGAARLLGLRAPSDVLDLGCGAGRHALELARLGHRVTGVDLSAPLLRAGRDAARRAGLEVRFLRADIRRPPRGRFDAAVSLFTSFGYFEREKDDLAVLRGARAALRPGGGLLLDVLNREWLVRRFTPRFWQRGAGPVAHVENRLELDLGSGRLSNRRTLHYKDGRRRATFLRFRVYSLTELSRLCAAAGLRVSRVWGGLDGRPYGLGSRRMILRSVRALALALLATASARAGEDPVLGGTKRLFERRQEAVAAIGELEATGLALTRLAERHEAGQRVSRGHRARVLARVNAAFRDLSRKRAAHKAELGRSHGIRGPEGERPAMIYSFQALHFERRMADAETRARRALERERAAFLKAEAARTRRRRAVAAAAAAALAGAGLLAWLAARRPRSRPGPHIPPAPSGVWTLEDRERKDV